MTPKRVLVLGAETKLGAETARALGEAEHTLALVASTSNAEAAFAVQRLARKLSAATSQAIDATNEAAVRVMVRQVAKQLGGIDAAVLCNDDPSAREHFHKFADKEMQRTGEPVFIDVAAGEDLNSLAHPSPST